MLAMPTFFDDPKQLFAPLGSTRPHHGGGAEIANYGKCESVNINKCGCYIAKLTT